MKNNLDDLTDDELDASYEAYKALIEAGLTKEQALSRTGLTAQIVKDFQAEEDELDLKADFKEVWDEDSEDEGDWKESSDMDEDSDWEETSTDEDYGLNEGGYDEDKY
ncbi:MAG TPA: hypothetical protein VF691_11440 [Cytophagaceae bacterium]|jgi:hypothetical protein